MIILNSLSANMVSLGTLRTRQAVLNFLQHVYEILRIAIQDRITGVKA